MASLWEVSAVVAMRDLQWIFAPNGGLPDAGINLAGNAESRLGDLAAHINDRFFLFEIKPQASNFSSEWKMKKRGGQEKRTKHAYASVLDMAKEWSAADPAKKDTEKLIQSLRCHHFAYWHVGVPPMAHNKLCLQPYQRAVIEGSLKNHGLDDVVKKIANDLSLGHSKHVDDLGNPFHFNKCQAGSVGAAHHGHLGIAVYQGNGTPYKWLPLGLLMAEFDDYIDLLMTNAPDYEEPLNSIAISTGGWQRVLGSTKDLARLLDDLRAAPSTAPNDVLTDAPSAAPNDVLAHARSRGVGCSTAVSVESKPLVAATDLTLSYQPRPRRKKL